MYGVDLKVVPLTAADGTSTAAAGPAAGIAAGSTPTVGSTIGATSELAVGSVNGSVNGSANGSVGSANGSTVGLANGSAVGVVGRLLVKGPYTIQRYWGHPTDAVDANGWFDTVSVIHATQSCHFTSPPRGIRGVVRHGDCYNRHLD